MKLFSVIAAVLTAATINAADTYLYWMVDNVTASGVDPAFSYATVRENNSTKPLNIFSTIGDTGNSDLTVVGYNDTGDIGYSTEAAYVSGFGSGDAFIFELWKEDGSGNGSLVGWSEVSKSMLTSYFYSNMSATGNSPYRVTSVSVVPEPTSGLLVLLGMGLLALRRRGAKVMA